MAGPRNGYPPRLSALYSGISDQKAQPCALVYETLSPEAHALCPVRPCEPHSGKGAQGRLCRYREVRGLVGWVHSPTISFSSRLMVSSAGRVVSCSGKSWNWFRDRSMALRCRRVLTSLGRSCRKFPSRWSSARWGGRVKERGKGSNPEVTVTAGLLGQEGGKEGSPPRGELHINAKGGVTPTTATHHSSWAPCCWLSNGRLCPAEVAHPCSGWHIWGHS